MDTEMEMISSSSDSPYKLLFRAVRLIPITHYVIGFGLILLVFVYNFLEFHIIQGMLTGFRGQPVCLTFNSCSELYHEVVSKCLLLHGRYLSTPWLSSPHLQTTFLRFFGKPPVFNYRRELFQTSDGGIIALDWLACSDVVEEDCQGHDGVPKDDKTPIVMVIPGLTSDSYSAYIKHLSFYMAKRGWNVVVSNHRGLGGVSLTSDFFYNGGWTEDIRNIVRHLHSRFPGVPLFVVGTSLGANMMVKYLGEDGDDVLIGGAAAVCCPWDLLLCDRFIGRKLVQRFYDKALASGLKSYAKTHQEFFTRLSNWDGIEKSRRVREFDTNGTCHVGKFETADIYYRQSSCAPYVGRVKVPLLCISALDDPVCTSEAIIWDECRKNKNVILATTEHGGHLGYFDGMDAKGIWWIRAVDEFLTVLSSSSMIHKRNKAKISFPASPLKLSIDRDPNVRKNGDGLVMKRNGYQRHVEDVPEKATTAQVVKEEKGNLDARRAVATSAIHSILFPIRRFMYQLVQYSNTSTWMMTVPAMGSGLRLFLEKLTSVKRISRKR